MSLGIKIAHYRDALQKKKEINSIIKELENSIDSNFINSAYQIITTIFDDINRKLDLYLPKDFGDMEKSIIITALDSSRETALLSINLKEIIDNRYDLHFVLHPPIEPYEIEVDLAKKSDAGN